MFQALTEWTGLPNGLRDVSARAVRRAFLLNAQVAKAGRLQALILHSNPRQVRLIGQALDYLDITGDNRALDALVAAYVRITPRDLLPIDAEILRRAAPEQLAAHVQALLPEATRFSVREHLALKCLQYNLRRHFRALVESQDPSERVDLHQRLLFALLGMGWTREVVFWRMLSAGSSMRVLADVAIGCAAERLEHVRLIDALTAAGGLSAEVALLASARWHHRMWLSRGRALPAHLQGRFDLAW